MAPGVLLAADRRLLAPAPAARLAVLRLLVGGYALGWLLIRLPYLLSVSRLDDERFDPVGPLWFLADPVGPRVGGAVLAIALGSGVAFVAGWRWRVSGPTFAVAFLAVTTYRNSWGQVFHTDNLVALHLLVIACWRAADVLSVDSARVPRARRQPAPSYGVPVRLCALITVLAYVIAGWAKIRHGGLDWVTGDVLRNWVAHDNLRKVVLGDQHSPLGEAAVAYGWLFPPMALVSLVVELGAPLALLGGRLRRVWIAMAWLFHVGVLVLMAIVFPYQLLGVAFAPLLPVERLADRSTWHRFRPATPARAPSGST